MKTRQGPRAVSEDRWKTGRNPEADEPREGAGGAGEARNDNLPGRYGRGDVGERDDGPAAPMRSTADPVDAEPYVGSTRARGFGHGEYGHPRHRREWEEVGRTGVYGQPVGDYAAYPGGLEHGDPARERRGPKGYVRSDERIREFICERLVRYHALDVSDVSVAVHEGHVTLEGTVPERGMKHAIEDVADDCWGVKDVDNRLRVAGRGQPAQEPR